MFSCFAPSKTTKAKGGRFLHLHLGFQGWVFAITQPHDLSVAMDFYGFLGIRTTDCAPSSPKLQEINPINQKEPILGPHIVYFCWGPGFESQNRLYDLCCARHRSSMSSYLQKHDRNKHRVCPTYGDCESFLNNGGLNPWNNSDKKQIIGPDNPTC